jgi:pimeloyl-ACP methyl ester carboxylesterase
MLTRASAAIDRGVVRWMGRMAPRRGLARGTRSPVDTGSELVSSDTRVRLIAQAVAYGDGTLGIPSPFFPAPDPPAIAMTVVGDGPLDTQVVDLRYPSDYRPFVAEARDLHQRAIENLTAHARWWTSGRGRPTIVLIHGWGADNHWLTARTFAVPYWLRHGYDVAAFVLPYHGQRTPAGLLSGAAFPTANPLRTNEAFGQAIFDLRGLSRFLRERGSTAVGAIGMSLGGCTTALWASVAGIGDVGGIDFAVALIPAVSMAQLIWRHGKHNPARARAIAAGVTEDLFVEAFAVAAPTTRPARLPGERLFVIAGRGDRITPPEHAEKLAAHWGVDVRWFDGGHLAQIGRGDVMRDVRRELGKLGFAGREVRMAPR